MTVSEELRDNSRAGVLRLLRAFADKDSMVDYTYGDPVQDWEQYSSLLRSQGWFQELFRREALQALRRFDEALRHGTHRRQTESMAQFAATDRGREVINLANVALGLIEN